MPSKGFEENIKELTKLRQKSSFRFESWLNNKKQILLALSWSLDMITGNKEEYPGWVPEFSLGEIPWLAKQGDVSIYQSWPDYFQKQKQKVNDFKKTGEMNPVCEELRNWLCLSDIAGDRKTFLLLKQYADLILEMLDSAEAAIYREQFTRIIDFHDRNLAALFYYVSGWQKIEKKMLPDYDFGRRRRAQVKEWSRGYRYHDLTINRDEEIRKCAGQVKERRELSSRLSPES